MTLTTVGLIFTITKHFVNNTLVDKMFSNWTKGTHNKIDDKVWSAIKKAANAGDLFIEALTGSLASIQEDYDKLTTEEKAEAKSEILVADLAIYPKEIANA